MSNGAYDLTSLLLPYHCNPPPTNTQQTCMATCQPGYVGAPVPFTCGADKEWSGNFTDACTLIDCGPTIQDADALNVTGVCTGDTRYTGDACTATCAPGYTGQPTTFQCGQNGKWQGQPRCQRIECGRPALLDSNVRLNCLDTVALGRGCRARCAVGSKMGTGFTCNADGQWEGFVSCVLPPTQNTTTTTTTTTTTSTTTQALSSASGSLESGAVVGVIIGVIAFVLLIVVVVLTLKFRSSMTNRTRPTSGPAPHLTKQGGNGAFVAETSMYANPSHASFRNHKAQVGCLSVRGEGREGGKGRAQNRCVCVCVWKVRGLFASNCHRLFDYMFEDTLLLPSR